MARSAARPATATRAILLRSVAYGEADRIVTLLTDEHGKLAVIARGARRSQKRFAGALEPFALIDAEVALGSGELGRLAGARVLRGYPRILGSLARMELAGRALEMVRELVPAREPDPRFVETIVELFERLEEDDGEAPESRLAFEMRFLAIAGLAPRLDACGRCGTRAEERAALFDPGLGAIVCRSCGGGPIHLASATRSRMMAAMRHGWTESARGWSAREIAEASGAIDAFARRHVGSARVTDTEDR